MKLDAYKFGLAAAGAVTVIWVFCTLLVLAVPVMTMHMGGYMMHSDFSGMSWHILGFGFVAGLFLWAVTAGVFAGLMAAIYNRML